MNGVVLDLLPAGNGLIPGVTRGGPTHRGKAGISLRLRLADTMMVAWGQFAGSGKGQPSYSTAFLSQPCCRLL